MVPAATARCACATSTPSSSARQTFPSGLWPTVKDCFGLHGHSAFGYVANKESGVGRKSATSVGLTTDLVHWLQAGKTVDISRCASESTDLLPAFRTASAASQPAAMPTRPVMPAAVTSSPSPWSPSPWLIDYRLTPVIVLPLLMLMLVVLMAMAVILCACSSRCVGILPYVILVLVLLAVFYYIGISHTAIIVLYGIMRLFIIPALRRNFASVVCGGQCKPFVVGHSLRATAASRCEGRKMVSCGRQVGLRPRYPPCWVYYAPLCRQSRHRRAGQ